MNGRRLSTSDYGGLLEDIAVSMESASLWRTLGYNTELRIDETRADFSVSCSKSSSYAAELDTHCSLLHSVCLSLSFLILRPTVELTKFLSTCNYLIISWLLNMEQIMPFVFSVYGRALLCLNFAYSKHLIEALFPRSADKLDILAHALVKLRNTWVLSDFNIFNVLKEIDMSAYKYKRMHQQISKSDEAKKKDQTKPINGGIEANENKLDTSLGVKNIVYTIAPINVAEIIAALTE